MNLFDEDKPVPPTNFRAAALKLYEAYPRRVARPKALRAINKALLKHPFEFLLERVKLYAQSDAGRAGEFTPHAATWFNQERYDDDPSTWNKKAKPGFRSPDQSDDFDALENRAE